MLYVCGSNAFGQLGLGYFDDVHGPIPTGLSVEVAKMIGGDNHAFVLCPNGEIYVAGRNNSGQLGFTGLDIMPKWTFMSIKYVSSGEPVRVVDVGCGWEYTVLVTDHGQVYVFGGSSQYQQHPSDKSHEEDLVIQASCSHGSSIHQPIQFPDVTVIRRVFCGPRHALALDEHGQLFGWGWNRHKQLSVDLPDVVSSPEKLSVSNVSEAACGMQHSVLLLAEGSVVSFGSNRRHQLLSYNDKPKAVQVFAGWSHSGAVLEDGRVLMSGRNDHLQLLESDSFAAVKAAVSGSEHSAALTPAGEVWTWGWNEHGNTGFDPIRFPASPPTRVETGGEVTQIGSGYGFSMWTTK